MTQVRFKYLTPQQRFFICNGCGPKGRLFGLIPMKVPNFVFKDSCDHHDFNYWLGNTEAHRIKADYQFYVSNKEAANGNRFYIFWAWIYYQSVRHGGSLAFYYGPTQRTLEDLLIKISNNRI